MIGGNPRDEWTLSSRLIRLAWKRVVDARRHSERARWFTVVINGYRKITFDVRGRTSRRFSVRAIAIKNNERSRRAASTFKRENYAAFGFRDQRFLADTTTKQRRWNFQSWKSWRKIRRNRDLATEHSPWFRNGRRRCISDRRGSKSAWKPGNCTMTCASNCRLLVY